MVKVFCCCSGITSLALLTIIYVIYRCTRKVYRPSNFEKVKGNNDNEPVELSFLLPNHSHVLAFDNPYYDVIAAMGLDDDIEEDYLNPLFENMLLQHDSDTELDDLYFAYRNDNLQVNRRQYPYDKDSGFSSGTI